MCHTDLVTDYFLRIVFILRKWKTFLKKKTFPPFFLLSSHKTNKKNFAPLHREFQSKKTPTDDIRAIVPYLKYIYISWRCLHRYRCNNFYVLIIIGYYWDVAALLRAKSQLFLEVYQTVYTLYNLLLRYIFRACSCRKKHS